MTIQQLEGFVAVAKEQSFTKAAKTLYLSQPGLTRQIRELEEELGCILFVRTTRSVSLTQSGRQALPYAELVLEDARKLKETLRQDSKSRFSSLRVGYVTPAHVPFLEKGLRVLTKTAPELSIHVQKDTPPGLLACLAERHLDCAFLHLPSVQGRKGLLFDTIHRGGVIARVPLGHPLADRTSLSCTDFDGEYIVVSSLVSPACYSYTKERMERAGVHPRYIEGNSEEAIRILAFSKNCIYLTSELSSEVPGFSSLPMEEMRGGFDLVLVRNRLNENPWVMAFSGAVKKAGSDASIDNEMV